MLEAIGTRRRPDLEGLGHLRSIGGLIKVIKGENGVKGDGRILRDSTFVSEVLRVSDEQLNRKYQLKAQDYDLGRLAGKLPLFLK